MAEPHSYMDKIEELGNTVIEQLEVFYWTGYNRVMELAGQEDLIYGQESDG